MTADIPAGLLWKDTAWLLITYSAEKESRQVSVNKQ